MALPTGSGSERLRRVTLHGNSNATTEILSGTALHIYTILSIIFCDQQSAAGTLDIRVNNGSADIYLLENSAHVADATFVWNDRFVLEEDDDLDVFNSVTNGDWYVTYIDQNWEN